MLIGATEDISYGDAVTLEIDGQELTGTVEDIDYRNGSVTWTWITTD